MTLRKSSMLSRRQISLLFSWEEEDANSITWKTAINHTLKLLSKGIWQAEIRFFFYSVLGSFSYSKGHFQNVVLHAPHFWMMSVKSKARRPRVSKRLEHFRWITRKSAWNRSSRFLLLFSMCQFVQTWSFSKMTTPFSCFVCSWPFSIRSFTLRGITTALAPKAWPFWLLLHLILEILFDNSFKLEVLPASL